MKNSVIQLINTSTSLSVSNHEPTRITNLAEPHQPVSACSSRRLVMSSSSANRPVAILPLERTSALGLGACPRAGKLDPCPRPEYISTTTSVPWSVTRTWQGDLINYESNISADLTISGSSTNYCLQHTLFHLHWPILELLSFCEIWPHAVTMINLLTYHVPTYMNGLLWKILLVSSMYVHFLK